MLFPKRILDSPMIDEIDEFTQQFSVNRTDIVMEALRAYISEQKAHLL
jgi:metal-responsive CopG/Arc/MetJ family transcriptional regulator